MVAQESETQERLSTLATERSHVADRLRNLAATHGHLAPSSPTLDLDAVSDTIGRLGSKANEQAAILVEAQDLVDSILAAFQAEVSIPQSFPSAALKNFDPRSSSSPLQERPTLPSSTVSRPSADNSRSTRPQPSRSPSTFERPEESSTASSTGTRRSSTPSASWRRWWGADRTTIRRWISRTGSSSSRSCSSTRITFVELLVGREVGELERDELRLRVEEGVAKLGEVSNALEERTR